MHKNQSFLYLIFLIVPFLGLVSCTEDSVMLENDQYQVEEPQIIRSSGLEDEFYASLSEGETYKLTDTIKIDWTNTIELTVRTNCKSAEAKFKTERTFKQNSTIDLLKLFPEAVFLEKDNKLAKCHILMISKAPNNSTFKQDFPNVGIDLTSNKNKIMVLSGKGQLMNSPVVQIEEKNLNHLYFLATEVAFDMVTLHCTDFKLNSISQTWPMAFDDFEWWKLKRDKITSQRQTCRLLATKADLISGLSKQFQITLEHDKAAYIEKHLFAVTEVGSHPSPIKKIDIKNEGSTPMHFRIPSLNLQNVQYQVYSVANSGQMAHHSSQAKLKLQLSSKLKTHKIKNMIYFSIPENSKVTVQISTHITYYCRYYLGKGELNQKAWSISLKTEALSSIEQLEEPHPRAQVISRYPIIANKELYTDIDGINTKTKTHADILRATNTKPLLCRGQTFGPEKTKIY